MENQTNVTLPLTAEQIAQKNAEFAKLTPSEQCVTIAKDVLEQLRLGRYYAEQFTYFSMPAPTAEPLKPGQDLQSLILQNDRTCAVCALGACFASAVRLSNGVALSEETISVDHSTDDNTANFGNDAVFNEKVASYFSNRQLALIESAFEKDDDFSRGYDVEDAIDFGQAYEDDTDRLQAIMENIVEHEGEFVP